MAAPILLDPVAAAAPSIGRGRGRICGPARGWVLRAARAAAFGAARVAALAAALALVPSPAAATTPLADGPATLSTGVPGNLAIALSVEFPTAVSVAHVDNTYDSSRRYLGYFDPAKCYEYNHSSTETSRHFYPSGLAISQQCTGGQAGKWSGNFLNWATMQTIDPFRWALTGGYRVVDTTTTTILEKAWASGQGGSANFPNRSLSGSTVVAGATPFSANSLQMRIQGLGNKMRFTVNGDLDDNSPTVWRPTTTFNANRVYEVSVRVKVCDSSTGAGGLEANCTAYPSGYHKPTGLVHQYADRIRFSLLSYLNDSDILRDGAVLRARQKFVGPRYTLPGASEVVNPAAEWDASTGVFLTNPDSADATTTGSDFGVTISNSGFINYLNKFGQITPGSYKTYDPVGELYYAALRYLRNLGNVPEWSAMGGASTSTRATYIDGFPVIRQWDDPILYSCQKNFVLGIGDVNTHADKNVPGPTNSSQEPTKPSAVSADTAVDAVAATNKVGQLHGLGNGLGSTHPYNGCCNSNGALMAGLAYHANTSDVRPDDPAKPQTLGKQTVQTFWLDVLEYQSYSNNNQFYLAAKYGGFKVPENFNPWTRSTDLPLDWWSTSGERVYGQNRPDNYFVAAQPDQMVGGLAQAFARISQQMRAFTSTFATALPQVVQSGAASFSSVFDAGTWTGDVSARTNEFNAGTGETTQTEVWSFADKLRTQLAGAGWDTGRRMITWRSDLQAGTPFRLASLSASQQAALNTPYRGGDASDYLNYLRGQRKHEVSSTDADSAKAYRNRDGLVGDIIRSQPVLVGPPSASYASGGNPGYAQFRSAWASRRPMLYVGTNAGVLHGVDASLTGATAGQEVFAYVPSALFNGPTAPGTDGLAALGKPDFVHHNRVDAVPAVFDIDFGRTAGGTGTDWRSVLVSGLGKGGRSYVAIDVTNPAAFGNEAQAAARVLWEFTDPDLGFTYGEPLAVKVKQYGWVLVFASGYNNANGRGYFFIVNPRTGQLLQKISTGQGTASAQAGLAHVQAFVRDRTDVTADAIYGGDLLGNLWRLDVTAATGAYPAPTRLAELRNGAGEVLPVTARPLVVEQPGTGRRFVTVGTGRLLHGNDIPSAQTQAFFAILDGTGAAFAMPASLPPGVSFPIPMARLRQLSNLTQPIVLNLNTELGWWVELGSVTSGPGWRVVSSPTAFNGIVAFAAMRPAGEVCSPSGTSRVFAIHLGTGQSALLNGSNPTAYVESVPGVVQNLRFYSVDGKARLLAGSDTGATRPLNGNWTATLGLRRLNWREINTVN